MGDYEGGELILEKTDGNELSVNIHDKPFIFDGSKYKHWTKNYEGNRMSVVLYKLKNKLI